MRAYKKIFSPKHCASGVANEGPAFPLLYSKSPRDNQPTHRSKVKAMVLFSGIISYSGSPRFSTASPYLPSLISMNPEL